MHLTIKQSIYSFVLAVTFLLLISAAFLFTRIEGVELLWDDFQRDAAVRQTLLLKLKTEFGYGGGIHEFKNLILRGHSHQHQNHADGARTRLEAVLAAVKEYGQLHHLRDEERDALTKIAAAAGKYRGMVDEVETMVKAGKTSQEIDAAMRVDDAPAIEGFEVLRKVYVEMTAEETRLINQAVVGAETVLLVSSLLTLLVTVGFGIFINATLAAKLKRIREGVGRMAEGDLALRIDIPQKPDEIEQVASHVNHMADVMARVIRTISIESDTVSASVNQLAEVRAMLLDDANSSTMIADVVHDENEELGTAIGQVAASVADANGRIDGINASADELSSHINTIAAAAEEASQNVSTVASAAEEMSANVAGVNESLAQVNDSVSTVASAVEQMNATLRDVRNRCQGASNASQEADAHAKGTHQVMERLGEAAREIDEVVGLINNIADQTNMLALNAAIEAAGAGAAGKGFAVVANEVKELARQTADATRQIAEKAKHIQDNAGEAGDATEQILKVIGRIRQANMEIESAVNEQAHTTGEIARSMESVSGAARNVTVAASELGDAAAEVARAMGEAAAGTIEIARSSSESAIAAQLVARQSQEIRGLVGNIMKIAEKTGATAQMVQENAGEAKRIAGFMEGSANHFQLLTKVVEGTSRSLAEAHVGISTGGHLFDMKVVKEGHLAWLGRLNDAIQGRTNLDPGKVASHKECVFGKWYFSEGESRFRGEALFVQIGKVHEQVHATARDTAQLVVEGKREEAKQRMSHFDVLRAELFKLLDKLYLESVR